MRGKQTYYYLQHNIRRQNHRQKELYLGKKISKNLDEIKQQFLMSFYEDEWIPILESIRDNYQKERKIMSRSQIAKNTQIFSVHFTYDTQKIEGSTLTLRETALLLDYGLTPSNKPMSDVKEAELHQKTFYEMIQYKNDLTLKTVLSWHNKMFSQTKPQNAGKTRNVYVGIAGSKITLPSPHAVQMLLQDFFSWYAKNKKKINPVLLSALVHLNFVTIHPFADGNGRTSRLMMNFVLQKYGYPMLNINYKDRKSYYTALERSHVQSNNIHFLKWFIKRYIKTYQHYINTES